MINLPNIEKSRFKKGDYAGYVGYSNGVWIIIRTNSTYGNWIARKRDDPNEPPIYAFTLKKMSEKLVALESTKKNPSDIRIVHNKLLGGWYVVRGPHQTPLNGRFNSKAEAQAWLNRRKKNHVDNFKRVVLKGDKFFVDSLLMDNNISRIFIKHAGDNLVYDIYVKHINKLSTLLNKHPELEGRFTKPKKIETLKQHDRRINREYKKSLRTVQEILKKKNPAKKYKRQLSVPEKHQLKVAYDTLKMSDVAAHHRMLGGPNKEEAREIIKRLTGKTMKENPMNLKPVGSNQTEIELDDGSTIFFSYQTPVAAFIPGKGVVKTDKKWSVTTSKHINKFIARTGAATVSSKPQSFFDNLVTAHKANPKSRSRKTARAFDARSIRKTRGKSRARKNASKYYLIMLTRAKVNYFLTGADTFDDDKKIARHFKIKELAITTAKGFANKYNFPLRIVSVS